MRIMMMMMMMMQTTSYTVDMMCIEKLFTT